MVGFCHGGNVPAGHDDDVEYDDNDDNDVDNIYLGKGIKNSERDGSSKEKVGHSQGENKNVPDHHDDKGRPHFEEKKIRKVLSGP